MGSDGNVALDASLRCSYSKPSDTKICAAALPCPAPVFATLRSKATYEIDYIGTIESGSEARGSFEQAFRAGVANACPASMAVTADDVTIHSITPGSVVVDFSIAVVGEPGVEARTVEAHKASFEYSVVNSPALAINGIAPSSVAAPTVVVPPRAVDCMGSWGSWGVCSEDCPHPPGAVKRP